MAKLTMVALEKMIGVLSERINNLENSTTSEAKDDGLELIGLMKLNERIEKIEKAMTPEALAKTLGEVAALRLL